MKKVLIFYASYGGGHISAAKSIQECININYPEIEVELIDCMKYISKTLEKVTTTAYKEFAKKVPWAWGRIYSDSQKGPLAHITTRSNKVMAIKLLKLLREKQPDLIISTHPFGSQMCSYLKRKGKIKSQIATIMTDFAPHDQWLVGSDYTDFYFVAHEKMKNYLIRSGISENKVFATGIPISNRFLIDYNRNEILDYFGLKDNIKTVLFFAGGEYGIGKKFTLKIFKCFVENFDDIQIIAIAGKNEKIKLSFEKIVANNNKQDSIKVLEYTNKVPELMSISDFVVTKPGGLTTTESLVSNLPIVVINPIPGQEEENAEFLENNNIAVWIRKGDDSETILKKLFSDEERINEMKFNTDTLAKKNSTKDICNILLG